MPEDRRLFLQAKNHAPIISKSSQIRDLARLRGQIDDERCNHAQKDVRNIGRYDAKGSAHEKGKVVSTRSQIGGCIIPLNKISRDHKSGNYVEQPHTGPPKWKYTAMLSNDHRHGNCPQGIDGVNATAHASDHNVHSTSCK